MSTSKDEWAVWAAVSAKEQVEDKASIPEQIRLGKEAATRWGGVVRDENILIVPGKSRHIILFEEAAAKIDAYRQLRELLRNRAIKVLAYYADDRLGRTASLIITVKALCREAGVILYELSNPPTKLEFVRHSTERSMLDGIRAAGAEGEVWELKRRTEMGMRRRAEQGKLANIPSWGYRKVYDSNGKEVIEIDETIAAWVRQIFEWYLQGASARTIAIRLNEKGVPCVRGGEWAASRVWDRLYQAYRYAGYSEYFKRSTLGREYVRAKGTWPPIISEETLQAFLRERKARENNRNLADTKYLLTGVVWCRTCTRRMYVTSALGPHTNPPKVYQRLDCPGDHPFRVISYRRILSQLREDLEGIDLVEYTPEDQELPTPRQSLENSILIKQATIADLEGQVQRAHRAFVTGNMDEEDYSSWRAQLRTRLETEHDELAELQQSLADELTRGDLRERCQEVIANWRYWLDHEDVTAANQWLRAHIRVWVLNGNIEDIDIL
jgi:DNA invertase Pin-like site-specific DNA recombinase